MQKIDSLPQKVYFLYSLLQTILKLYFFGAKNKVWCKKQALVQLSVAWCKKLLETDLRVRAPAAICGEAARAESVWLSKASIG